MSFWTLIRVSGAAALICIWVLCSLSADPASPSRGTGQARTAPLIRP